MSDKLDPLLIPGMLHLLAKRAARDASNPPEFERGAVLVVTRSIVGTHEWDRSMASGLATVTLEAGDVVECLGSDLISPMSVLPITSNIDAFVERAVNAADRPYVERHRLVIRIKTSNLREHFSEKNQTCGGLDA